MPYVGSRKAALDFGAGALVEARFLLEQGFERVVAVDGDPSVAANAEKMGDPRLETVIAEFEDFQFPENAFDLVDAQHSLPFVRSAHFPKVFGNLTQSLKEGGVFVGQLFGTRDSRIDKSYMTFHTATEVQKLLQDMEVIQCREIENDELEKDGNMMHAHIFRIIARKRTETGATEQQ